MITALLVLAIIWLAISGMPIFAVIATIAMLGFHAQEIDLMVMAIELYRISDTPMLLSLPLFTLTGYILAESQASKRLVRSTQAMIGWVPAGLALIAFITCALFTAFTGASGVTIVAIGALLYPALKQVGFGERFSLGLVTTSGSLGLLLAPSLPLILYGIIAQQVGAGPSFSIQDLFLAGILPALLMVSLLCAWALWYSKDTVIQRQDFSRKELGAALWEAKWELPLPFFVGGGIYAGWLAVSETAAVAALYVIIVEVFVYREIRLKKLPQIFRKAMIMSGSIILILGVSLAMTNVIVDAEIPAMLFDFVQTHIDSKISFLILLNIFLLVLGAILDIFSAIIIMVPLILPMAVNFGIHPLHLGIIFLANMQIGYFTPPVGMNLFIASYRFGKPITTLYSATLPFMVVLLIALLIITYVPELSLGLIDIAE
ncbi:MAG: TRAP transporter large permease [Cellvibrionaceae bacterium]